MSRELHPYILSNTGLALHCGTLQTTAIIDPAFDEFTLKWNILL